MQLAGRGAPARPGYRGSGLGSPLLPSQAPPSLGKAGFGRQPYVPDMEKVGGGPRWGFPCLVLRALHDARRKTNPVCTLHPQPHPTSGAVKKAVKKAGKAGPGQGCSGGLQAEVEAGPIVGLSVGCWWG